MKKNSIGKIALISTVLSGLLGINLFAKEVSLEDKVSSLYVSYFNRAPDYSGLNYWVTTGNTVLQHGGDVLSVLKDLSAGFAQHPTFISTYSSMSDEDFVKAIYRNSLGREGDAQGIKYWTTLLINGKSRSDMVAEFMNLSLTLDLTPENFPLLSQAELDAAIERQKLITNKVNVAKEFADILKTATNVEDSQNPENDPAYLASKKVLESVGLDESSVDEAIGKIYALRSENSFAINDILNNWQGIQPDMGFKGGTSTGGSSSGVNGIPKDTNGLLIYNNISVAGANEAAREIHIANNNYNNRYDAPSDLHCPDYGFTQLMSTDNTGGIVAKTYIDSLSSFQMCIEQDHSNASDSGDVDMALYDY